MMAKELILVNVGDGIRNQLDRKFACSEFRKWTGDSLRGARWR